MNKNNSSTNQTTRRAFVKNSSLLAGGLLAAPLLSKANYFSGADDTIKIALVGCGGRGTGAASQALSTKQNVKLVAMADAFQDRLDNAYKSISEEIDAKRIDVPADRRFVGFDAYEKAIALADVVILATPPGFRPIHFEEAVKQGKHIFMEKPVATDPAGVQKVLAAAAIAKQKKLNVVVGLQRHYQNSYRELFKRKDAIGDITAAQAWWNGDGVWVHPRKEGQTEMEYQMRNWYYFNWLCGDHITEQHIHNIDVINWFKGSYPVKAQGMGGREVRTGKDYGEIFDHHYVEFHYADGSILNSQCRHQPKTMSKVDELLIGTKGKIFAGAANIVDHKGKVLYQFDRKTENNPYQSEHDELFEAIAKGQFKFSDAENGAKSTMTSILGRMATYSGQVIDWDKAINSGIDIHPKVYDWAATPPIVPNADGFYPVAVPGVTQYV
ncbi:Gfo/Idh/MocA family oxidoreductase [Agriterribacter sp.]|uniref:Gfo/Idh/MocA family protein n=1 Tax=Agriterribacter sp. TaxID=2821509 RepID=UPI002C89DFFE|nr:Gfo/Idh/MocA family oxidoreductase [Agriterribacter sp.]HRO45577.1 Gfo/Idh/MocA family oxidoreductase [Agriterribacter sp.]HRQ17227.1 Gfo/Idh/MocA family oxidoreductase [Agriterribacter sp.]